MAIRKTKSAVLEEAAPKRKRIKGMTPVEATTVSADEPTIEQANEGEAESSPEKVTAARKPAVKDAVTSALAKCGSKKEMVELVRGHKAFPSINEEAFKRTVKGMKETPDGLFRMRIGNLLRGAVKKAESKKLKKVSG